MRSSALQARLEQLVHEQDFDVVQFEGIEMATYLPLVRGQKTRASLIFDTFNAEYRLQAQIAQVEARSGLRRVPAAFYSCIQAMRLKRYERGLCLTADATIAVSEEDAASLRPLCGSRPLHIVPSGLFVDDYAESVPIDLGSQSLVFTGKMDYRPNIDAVTWFAHAIFPHILKTIPDVVWYVVGQRPTAAVEALAEHPNIHVTDTVPDVVPYLSGAAVYIAPLRMGSGTRLKLLEAMAAGSAIVATPTAASGLDSETREAMNIADSEVAFAQAVTDLLSSPDKRRDYAERARRVVRARYDWSVLAPRLEAVYEDTAVG
jgi:glycosyltransferase involved in cell wall biosynthesis